MMMVVVEPKDLSPIFTVGDKIKTLTPVNVRLGPGTNYASFETVPAGTTGVVYGYDNGLNGVMAKEYYWWRVLLEIDGRDVIGWVIDLALTPFLP
jgi:SH3-like domain-containing protein